jgi:hypothetical protein
VNPNDLPAGALRDAGSSHGDAAPDSASPLSAHDALTPLLHGATTAAALVGAGLPALEAAPLPAAVVGELLALVGDSRMPMVRFCTAGRPQVHVARSCVNLHGEHIGQAVVLLFDGGDPAQPIVTGVLRSAAALPLGERPAQVDVDADGQHVVISAGEQLVLRCGKASITLTRAGKVLIQGSHVSSRATGVNRIKGGSVQLN